MRPDREHRLRRQPDEPTRRGGGDRDPESPTVPARLAAGRRERRHPGGVCPAAGRPGQAGRAREACRGRQARREQARRGREAAAPAATTAPAAPAAAAQPTAVAKPPESKPAADAKPVSRTPAGELKIGLHAKLTTLDPQGQQSVDGITHSAMQHVFDTLVGRDSASGNLVPKLATSWEAPDANTWVFKLRQGVKFHDGTDFTANDVKASLERIQAQKGPLAPLFAAVEAVETPDPMTVRFKMKQAGRHDPGQLHAADGRPGRADQRGRLLQQADRHRAVQVRLLAGRRRPARRGERPVLGRPARPRRRSSSSTSRRSRRG